MYMEDAEDKSSSFPGIVGTLKDLELFSGGADKRQVPRTASWLVQVSEIVSLHLATRWWPRVVALQKTSERRW